MLAALMPISPMPAEENKLRTVGMVVLIDFFPSFDETAILKIENSQVKCTDRGPTLFAHPRGSSYIFVCFFDCYVICGLFVGVLDLLYFAKVRAHAIYMRKNTNLFR